MNRQSRRQFLAGAATATITFSAGCSFTENNDSTPTPDNSLPLQWLDIVNSTDETPTVDYRLEKDSTTVLNESIELEPADGRESSLVRREIPQESQDAGTWMLHAELEGGEQEFSFQPEPKSDAPSDPVYFIRLDYWDGIGLHGVLHTQSEFE
jgi:hypothetical protein